MSIFDRLDQITSRAVDALNSESFTLSPMVRTPNGRSTADAERPVVTGRGIFDLHGDDLPLELGNRDRSGNDLRTLLNDPTPILSIDRSYFPTPAQEPRQGDLVEFPGRSDLGAFAVVRAQRDGLSRVVLRLVQSVA